MGVPLQKRWEGRACYWCTVILTECLLEIWCGPFLCGGGSVRCRPGPVQTTWIICDTKSTLLSNERGRPCASPASTVPAHPSVEGDSHRCLCKLWKGTALIHLVLKCRWTAASPRRLIYFTLHDQGLCVPFHTCREIYSWLKLVSDFFFFSTLTFLKGTNNLLTKPESLWNPADFGVIFLFLHVDVTACSMNWSNLPTVRVKQMIFN